MNSGLSTRKWRPFDPSRSAVIVIDCQKEWLDPKGSLFAPSTPVVVPHINRLLSAARIRRVPIFFVRVEHIGPEMGIEHEWGKPEHCIAGSIGAEFVDDLQPQPWEYVITKRKYSAFFGTDLEIFLRNLKVDSLIITGVATDVCVRATATDAWQYDYHVYLPRECAAGTSVEQHESALIHIDRRIGWVCSLEQILQELNSDGDLYAAGDPPAAGSAGNG